MYDQMKQKSPQGACALFFDVDGTLVDASGASDPGADITAAHPSPGVVDAFARLRKRGHATFICTGRTHHIVSDELLALGATGMICGAGASVYIGDELKYKTEIAQDLLRESTERLLDAGVHAMLEGEETSVALSATGETYEGIPGVKTASTFAEVATFAPELSFSKIVFDAASFEAFRPHEEFFRSHYTLCDLGVGLIEISMIGVDKGFGVRHALALLDYRPERVFGFGDSENDLAMLAAVEVPVAMGNALPQVKAIADHITDPVQEDGVVSALEHFGLI
ncbi:Cof-type HAD-IIB family hydrolase [Collinsella sp. AGMB00827]|uniref:Cof-type HAD-IIB family hydrolase n=1 Tax=Collinsella ureilytica TaxID=2869515 RepID=A0ABS7MKY4_9ACTN|nr:HAD family hydrolase [Collinsella urealyticum]MBY4797708.1 Cof-type HAD-IIB family hydrolase [Collinsella urealyticum]